VVALVQGTLVLGTIKLFSFAQRPVWDKPAKSARETEVGTQVVSDWHFAARGQSGLSLTLPANICYNVSPTHKAGRMC